MLISNPGMVLHTMVLEVQMYNITWCGLAAASPGVWLCRMLGISTRYSCFLVESLVMEGLEYC